MSSREVLPGVLTFTALLIAYGAAGTAAAVGLGWSLAWTGGGIDAKWFGGACIGSLMTATLMLITGPPWAPHLKKLTRQDQGQEAD